MVYLRRTLIRLLVSRNPHLCSLLLRTNDTITIFASSPCKNLTKLANRLKIKSVPESYPQWRYEPAASERPCLVWRPQVLDSRQLC